jgi:cell division protein ZapA
VAQVTLNVDGNPYRLACNDGEEEHLQALAATISDKVGEIAQAMGQVGDAKLILMASLVLLDEARANSAKAAQAAQDAQASVDAVAAEAAKGVDAIAAAAAKIEVIADQIETP